MQFLQARPHSTIIDFRLLSRQLACGSFLSANSKAFAGRRVGTVRDGFSACFRVILQTTRNLKTLANLSGKFGEDWNIHWQTSIRCGSHGIRRRAVFKQLAHLRGLIVDHADK